MTQHVARPPAPKSRSRRAGLLFAVIYLLALGGVAQGAWRVYDRQVHEAVKDVKKEVADFRADVKPKWSSAAGGTRNPYTGRQKDYDLPSNVAREEKYGMKAKCGEEATFSGAEIWKVPALPAENAIVGSGLTELNTEICQRLVAAENRRFQQVMNTMSRIKERNDALKALAENRSSIDEKGEIDANTNNLQLSIADAQVEIQYMQATIAAYDSLIATLKQSQDTVANRTMNGKNEAAEAIRMTALVAAIEAAKLAH